ncbi:MAG: SRPBCC family protein [Silvibacterium sp.]|nr:SRPBCC family protein [Silvibacterium sp.]
MNQSNLPFSRQASSQFPFGSKGLLLGAGALMLYGLTRRSKSGLALATAGGVLAFRAAKPQSAPQNTRATFLVNTSPERAYVLWRDFQNLPRFMAHLKSVQVLEGNRSEWIAVGPMDREVRWTAEITGERPNELIAWRSLPGSDVETSGSVEFRRDPLDRGTYVTAEVRYRIPGGSATAALAGIFGKHPEFMVREALRRFKSLVEAGETPTISGQTHGPRGLHGRTEEVLFRETTNHPEPQAASGLPRIA